MRELTQPLMFAAVAALVSLPLTSCQSEPDTPVEVATEMRKCIEEMSQVIDGVKDKESADAAADDIASLGRQYKALKTISDTMRPPTPEEKEALRKLQPELEKTGMNFFGKLLGLGATHCYGSEKLEKAFESIMK